MIVIVCGLPGSGKSYFAYHLAARIGMGYLSSDHLRKEVSANPGYSEREKLHVYLDMLARMKAAVKSNRDLVLDATFYKDDIRRKFRDAAGDETQLIFIEVQAAESVIRQRLQTAREDSDAGFEVYKKIKQQWEPLTEPHLVLKSGNNNIESLLHKAEKFCCLHDDQRSGK